MCGQFKLSLILQVSITYPGFDLLFYRSLCPSIYGHEVILICKRHHIQETGFMMNFSVLFSYFMCVVPIVRW